MTGNSSKNIAIIGGGPSGLMAAEILAKAGHVVTIYDRMPSLGRKLLMAGRGGLNLTHSENLEKFISRYGASADWISPYIHAFPPDALRAWCEGLGQETFIGSSGRVFPRLMKAAPLLRAWLLRLKQLGVKYTTRHNWQGFERDALRFINNDTQILVKPDATLLAMGGASWPRLGSDGKWAEILTLCGIGISDLRPANCGFNVAWSDYFSKNFAGIPLKSLSLTHKNISHQGEIMLTAKGLEGGAIYALSVFLRESIDKEGSALLHIDFRPTMSLAALQAKLETPRGNQSLSTFLRKAGFSQASIALLWETISKEKLKEATAADLASYLKDLPIMLNSSVGLARAISTAGGIKRNSIDKNFMLKTKPGVFAAGEMLDWEAPTGGYLLQGCFSTAVAAALGILNFLEKQDETGK